MQISQSFADEGESQQNSLDELRAIFDSDKLTSQKRPRIDQQQQGKLASSKHIVADQLTKAIENAEVLAVRTDQQEIQAIF